MAPLTTGAGREIEPTVVSGIGATPTRVALLLGWAGMVAASVLRGEPPVPAVIGLAATVVGAIVVTTPGPDRLPVEHRVAMIAVTVVHIVAAVSLDVQAGGLGLLLAEVWGYQLAMLAMRGHVHTAWLGAGLVVVLTIGAMMLRPQQAPTGSTLVLPLVIVVLGTIAGWVLRVRQRRILEQWRLDTEEEVELAEGRAVALRQADHIHAITSEVRPLLRQIARDEPLSALDRELLRLTQLSLRDRVRVPRLSRPTLLAAIAAARARGVDVTLLDVGDPDAGLREETLDALEEAINGVTSGELTIRLLPPGREAQATMLLSTDSGSDLRLVT